MSLKEGILRINRLYAGSDPFSGYYVSWYSSFDYQTQIYFNGGIGWIWICT